MAISDREFSSVGRGRKIAYRPFNSAEDTIPLASELSRSSLVDRLTAQVLAGESATPIQSQEGQFVPTALQILDFIHPSKKAKKTQKAQRTK